MKPSPLHIGRFFPNLAFVNHEIFDELMLFMIPSSRTITISDDFSMAQHVVHILMDFLS
jgi:hypothetical protein